MDAYAQVEQQLSFKAIMRPSVEQSEVAGSASAPRRAMTVWERRLWLALWPVSLAVVIVGELGFWIHHVDLRETYPLDLAVSSSSIVAGLLLWSQRPGNRTGLLLVLAGYLWALSGIRGYENPVAFGIGELLDVGYGLLLGHALFAYPTGRLRSRFSRVVVALGYSIWGVEIVRALTLDLGDQNALVVWRNLELSESLFYVTTGMIFAYALAGVSTLAVRWFRAGPVGRRVYTPVLTAGGIWAATWVLNGAVQTTTGTEPDWVFFPPIVAGIVLSVSFLFGLMRSTLDRSAVGDIAIQVGSAATAARTMQQVLAETLHDPSLELAYWLRDQGVFVDAAGRRIELPPDDGPRVATLIERDGQRLGAIVHDRALLEDPRLVETVSATAGLLLENERLQAEVQAQLEQVRASRARLVEAADAERRRVERDLHDGAQQRLVTLSLALGLAREQAASNGDDTLSRSLAESSEEVTRALDELRELGRGLHPTILTEAGLGPALESLAERSTIPATVLSAPVERLPQAVEAGAYFIASEALANVAKHARASHVALSARRDDGVLVLEVTDDGVGGADPAAGSGLTGLEDRAAALGGRLLIESPTGSGTRIVAEIPCE